MCVYCTVLVQMINLLIMLMGFVVILGTLEVKLKYYFKMRIP
jgi:hypothetical protein